MFCCSELKKRELLPLSVHETAGNQACFCFLNTNYTLISTYIIYNYMILIYHTHKGLVEVSKKFGSSGMLQHVPVFLACLCVSMVICLICFLHGMLRCPKSRAHGPNSLITTPAL